MEQRKNEWRMRRDSKKKKRRNKGVNLLKALKHYHMDKIKTKSIVNHM